MFSDVCTRTLTLFDSDTLSSAEAFDLIVETLQASTERAIVSISLDGAIVLWNEGATRMFGRTFRDVFDRQAAEVLCGSPDPDPANALPMRALRDGQWEGTRACVRADGERFTARITITPRHDARGSHVGFVIVAEDESKGGGRLFPLLESGPDAMLIVNGDSRITLVNSQLEKLFGYTSSELVGRPVELLVPKPFPISQRGRHQNFFKGASLRRRRMGLDLFGRRKNGSEFPIEVSLSPIETEEGTWVVSAIRDITKRSHAENKRFEQALTEKNREFEKANRAKDQFLASMSHELRTPLNAIIGFTGTLLMKLPGPLTDEQESQLTTVRASAHHLLSLINDILDLARVESGKVELHLEPVVLQQEIQNVVSSLQALAEEKGLRLDASMPASEIVAQSDRRSLQQILINLTTNAIKYTDAGSVRMELARKQIASRHFVDISVVDSGIGIKEEDRAKIFQAFEQLDKSSTRRFEGAGLGLYLSQHLAALLGAQLLCQSEIGNGSTFTLRLEESDRCALES